MYDTSNPFFFNIYEWELATGKIGQYQGILRSVSELGRRIEIVYTYLQQQQAIQLSGIFAVFLWVPLQNSLWLAQLLNAPSGDALWPVLLWVPAKDPLWSCPTVSALAGRPLTCASVNAPARPKCYFEWPCRIPCPTVSALAESPLTCAAVNAPAGPEYYCEWPCRIPCDLVLVWALQQNALWPVLLWIWGAACCAWFYSWQ